jgi:Icc-related predicted phosphoesterase
MMSGDLTGKAVIPVVEESPGIHVAYSHKAVGEDRVAKDTQELQALEKGLSAIGFYPVAMSKDEYESLRSSPAKLNALFEKEMLGRLKVWVESCENELPQSGVKCFIMPGNDDPVQASGIISSSNFVVDPESKCLPLDGHHEMISLGLSNPTPWKTPREVSEEKLGEIIDSMATSVKDMRNCVFNFHCPPYNSNIDTAPVLDENLTPKVTVGGMVVEPVGSRAIRGAIEKYQPMLSLHGHIHEAPGETKIGKTICLNPGSEYHAGILRAYLVNINEKGVQSYLRVEA